jgi:hypothetical protein
MSRRTANPAGGQFATDACGIGMIRLGRLDGVSGGKLSKVFMAAPSLRSGHALARGEISRAPEPPCPEGRRLRPFGLRSLPREHAVGAYVPPDRRALRMAVVQASGTCQTARAARGWNRTDQLNVRRYRAKLYISLNSTHSLPGPRGGAKGGIRVHRRWRCGSGWDRERARTIRRKSTHFVRVHPLRSTLIGGFPQKEFSGAALALWPIKKRVRRCLASHRTPSVAYQRKLVAIA